MDRIASFTINHLDLMPGLYVSRRDAKGDCVTTTFDLRITAPNREPVVDTPALHTIEHLAATFLRNSEKKDDVIYFGPMGCRTGCYLVMFGIWILRMYWIWYLRCATSLLDSRERFREQLRNSVATIRSRIWIWRSITLRNTRMHW